MRREGLYSCHIVELCRTEEVGALAGLTPKARRPLHPFHEFGAGDDLKRPPTGGSLAG